MVTIIDSRDLALFSWHWLSLESVKIHETNLDTDPNWTAQGQWAFGQPAGSGSTYGNPDPNSGYDSNNVYGVNLDGDYTVSLGEPYYLIAGPFECTDHSDMILKFSRWLNTDSPDYVASKIEASNDASSWTLIWEHAGSSQIADSNWEKVQYDISSVADDQKSVYIRWS